MAKSKKNKKGLAEKVAGGKANGPAKLNPFDVRFVKDKQAVIGKKKRAEVGKPGITRAKAIKKRKETLLQEFKLKNKTNLFLDKRIGEKDSNLSSEDKMIARFTAERMRGTGKTSIFNLGDDLNLTHGGADIDSIDRFEDPKSDDEEEEELLGKQFVDSAHFGGFMSQADDEFKAGKGNSRKEFIENLIRESKKKKAEKRKADEEAEEKTDDLDKSWKDLYKGQNDIWAGMKRSQDDEAPAANYDPYDMLVKSLGFEKKEARGGERLKTDDEKLVEEKERLEKLEEDRQRRMRGEKVSSKVQHVSVDDTGEDGGQKKKVKMSRKEQRKVMKQLLKEKSNEEGDEKNEEEGEEDEEDESGEEEEEESEEESDDDADSEEDEDEDGYSDLEESDGEEKPGNLNEKDEYDSKVEEMKEAASAEIPYVIPVPTDYDTLCGLLLGRGAEEQAIVLDRLLACNHPKLGGDSKPALLTHFKLLLQLVQDTALALDSPSKAGSCLATLDVLSTRLFRLVGLFQQEAGVVMQELVKEKFSEWWELPRRRMPGPDTLIFLQLVHLLFPTSDYRHPVATPALTFATAVLSTVRPTDRASVASAILLCTIVLQYTSLAKRFCPELVNCLLGLLFVAGEKHKVRPPAPCKGGALLLLSTPATSCAPSNLRLTETVSVKDIDDTFKVEAMEASLKLLQKVIGLTSDLASSKEIFQPFEPVLDAIDRSKYPVHIVKAMETVASAIGDMGEKQGRVVRPAKQVPMLRMMEPELEEDFKPGQKKRQGSREMLEEQKMRHKLKQERKGARKEIRADNAFLATQRAKLSRAKDADRQEKTKAIFSGLASQEGDYKKLLKTKKKF